MRLSFEELNDPKRRRIIPKVPGLYKVFLPDDMDMVIAEKTRACDRCYKIKDQKGKTYLEKIWDSLKKAGTLEDRVLYIGKGIDINKRLNLYKRVMYNNGYNHSGGVYICQIENCENLVVEWYEHHSEAVTKFLNFSKEKQKDISNPIRKKVEEELLAKESAWIVEYRENHEGLFPFANRKN